MAKAINGYIIDNIKNIRMTTFKGSLNAQQQPVVTYDDLLDVFDSSTNSIKLDFDIPDSSKTEGEGVVLEVLEQQPTSGTFEIEISEMPGLEYWHKFLGWFKSTKNSVLGLTNNICTPGVYLQFDMIPRVETCGSQVAGSTDLVRVKLPNVKLQVPSLELNAATSDGPGENTFTITGSFSVSEDPAWHGYGLEIVYAQLDNSLPGFNATQIIKGKDVYYPPALPSFKLTQEKLTLVNGTPVSDSDNKVNLRIISRTGVAITNTAKAPTSDSAGNSVADFTLASFTGIQTSTLYSIVDVNSGLTLGTFTTPNPIQQPGGNPIKRKK